MAASQVKARQSGLGSDCPGGVGYRRLGQRNAVKECQGMSGLGMLRKRKAVEAKARVARRVFFWRVQESRGSRGLVCRVVPRHGRRGLSVQGSRGCACLVMSSHG